MATKPSALTAITPSATTVAGGLGAAVGVVTLYLVERFSGPLPEPVQLAVATIVGAIVGFITNKVSGGTP